MSRSDANAKQFEVVICCPTIVVRDGREHLAPDRNAFLHTFSITVKTLATMCSCLEHERPLFAEMLAQPRCYCLARTPSLIPRRRSVPWDGSWHRCTAVSTPIEWALGRPPMPASAGAYTFWTDARAMPAQGKGFASAPACDRLRYIPNYMTFDFCDIKFDRWSYSNFFFIKYHFFYCVLLY
jgi:hypothetical protein